MIACCDSDKINEVTSNTTALGLLTGLCVRDPVDRLIVCGTVYDGSTKTIFWDQSQEYDIVSRSRISIKCYIAFDTETPTKWINQSSKQLNPWYFVFYSYSKLCFVCFRLWKCCNC